jgi:thiamine-phosphate pyrophosphorylase
MFKIIAVTNRRLCAGPAFLSRIETLAVAGIDALILREKDLSPPEYEALARQAAAVCARQGVPFIPHSFIETARALGCEKLHLSGEAFRWNSGRLRLPRRGFRRIAADSAGLALGVSVHSAEEARYAEDHNAAWLIAGHVFPTDCKKGLEARGLDFLSAVCGAVTIPVYGIGGVTEENIALLPQTGAAGVCLMSSLMECADPAALITRLRERAASPSTTLPPLS